MPPEAPNLPPTDPDCATTRPGKLVPYYSVERGFLSLADEWAQAAVLAGQEEIMPPTADLAALACLMIAKERVSHSIARFRVA
jgi:hypothetical protein